MKVNPSKTINELISMLSLVSDIEKERRNFHSWKVAILSGLILKKSPSLLRKEAFYASMLHDIGGMGFSFHIIHYLNRNDVTSQNILFAHPIVGAQLTSELPCMEGAARLILNHHEWLNGRGYPAAKPGEKIPFGSQVIRVSDAIDILLQTKLYKDLKTFKKQLLPRINEEFPEKLFKKAISVLEKNALFSKISFEKNLPEIFNSVRNDVGLLRIPYRIDAIGKTLKVVAEISDMKHPYSYGHSARVSRYSLAVAMNLRLPHDEITRIKWAGLLHDLGKVSVPRKVLDKPSALMPDEFERVKEHAKLTLEIMEMAPSLKEVALLASSHHEHFDGSGYPVGLKGDRIPRGTRIISICDAFDALTSNRPYHNAITTKKACSIIKMNAGKNFDPALVKLALPVLKKITE